MYILVCSTTTHVPTFYLKTTCVRTCSLHLEDITQLLYVCVYKCTYICAKKNLPLPFNETERNGSFRSRLIIFRYPFWIRSRSVRIFRLFWIRFNLFPCCAICFSAWQFIILIKERACMLFNRKNGFRRLHQKKDIVLPR